MGESAPVNQLSLPTKIENAAKGTIAGTALGFIPEALLGLPPFTLSSLGALVGTIIGYRQKSPIR